MVASAEVRAAKGLELEPSSSNATGFTGVNKQQGKYLVQGSGQRGWPASPRHLCYARGGGVVLRSAHWSSASCAH